MPPKSRNKRVTAVEPSTSSAGSSSAPTETASSRKRSRSNQDTQSQSSHTTTTGATSVSPRGRSRSAEPASKRKTTQGQNLAERNAASPDCQPTSSTSEVWTENGTIFKESQGVKYFFDEEIPAWVEWGTITAQNRDRVPQTLNLPPVHQTALSQQPQSQSAPPPPLQPRGHQQDQVTLGPIYKSETCSRSCPLRPERVLLQSAGQRFNKLPNELTTFRVFWTIPELSWRL